MHLLHLRLKLDHANAANETFDFTDNFLLNATTAVPPRHAASVTPLLVIPAYNGIEVAVAVLIVAGLSCFLGMFLTWRFFKNNPINACNVGSSGENRKLNSAQNRLNYGGAPFLKHNESIKFQLPSLDRNTIAGSGARPDFRYSNSLTVADDDLSIACPPIPMVYMPEIMVEMFEDDTEPLVSSHGSPSSTRAAWQAAGRAHSLPSSSTHLVRKISLSELANLMSNDTPKMKGAVSTSSVNRKMSNSGSSMLSPPSASERRKSWGFDITSDSIDKKLYGSITRRLSSDVRRDIGKLCFSVTYCPIEEKLSVHLMRGVGLKPRRPKDSIDPYVKISLLPTRDKLVSKIHRSTLNPVFNERFVFTLRSDKIPEAVLKFGIYDYDRFSRKMNLGYVLFAIGEHEVTKDGTDELWMPLMESIPGKIFMGELQYSLSYIPENNILRVGILKLKNIELKACEKGVGIYVQVMVFKGDTILVRKQTRKVKTKTSTAEMDEVVEFNVPPPMANQLRIELEVHTRNTLGTSRLIGGTSAGPFKMTPSNTMDHWSEMLANAKTPVTRWHKLT